MLQFYRRYILPLYFSSRFYWTFVAVIALFIVSYSLPALFEIVQVLLLLFVLISVLDYVLLFRNNFNVHARRIVADRLSNGDANEVTIKLQRITPFRISAAIIDEVPVQFQQRNFQEKIDMSEDGDYNIIYKLTPTTRGEYVFSDINVYVRSPFGLIVKRNIIKAEKTVRVYPSFFPMRQFELLAYSNNLAESGSRKIRKIGHSLEFEQIKDYVAGDDIRSINWNATARRGGQLMVNNYTDERSQQVYCIIDKGRVMKMAFRGMSLMDYAINATLILSRVALLRQDKAGLVTFSEEPGHFLPADRKGSQMGAILETLYNQETRFLETDFEKLYAVVRTRITQRSLVILFTNFESMSGLERQLPFIRAIAKMHLVLVVFFENTELRQLTQSKVNSIEDLYTRTIAERFAYEKKLMVKELQQHGIFSILTAPENLTIDTVNKYLELKARQAI